jgi:hypothetical protein
VELAFPNPSRSYDETMRGVRFWAYDQIMEVVFFIQIAALLKIDSHSETDEAGLLDTFDVNRDRIHRLASNIYSRRRTNSHIFSFTLTASDL